MKNLLALGGPTRELVFGSVDQKEFKKGQMKMSKKYKRKNENADDEEPEFLRFENDLDMNDHDNDNLKVFHGKVKFNYKKLLLPTVAQEADRFHASDALVASIVNATLIDVGLISKKDQDLVVTRAKIRLERKKGRKLCIAKNMEENSGKLTCLGFDGKKTDTLCFTEDNKRRKLVKDHYSFTNSEGKYLTHQTLNVSSTGKNIANAVLDVLLEYNSLDVISALASDGTVTNTGRLSGAIHLVELKLERNLHWLVCLLHFNELPLRALFYDLDGTTSGPRSFTGPIGKLVAGDLDSNPGVPFDLIPVDLPCMPQEIVDDLSTDQRQLLSSLVLISTGVRHPPVDWKLRKLCHSHSRWLTLGTRILALYTQTTNPTSKLTQLATYVAQVFIMILMKKQCFSELHKFG